MAENPPKLKKRKIHEIMTYLSPKRVIESPDKGKRLISRGITSKAMDYIMDYLNGHLKELVEACEQSLREINENPNSYYQQHRYDDQVVKKAIGKIKGGM